MSTASERAGPISLAEALQEHSAEGAEILFSEPAPLIRASVLLMSCLVVAAIAWSFFGHADVIVAAPGSLAPEDEVRRVYSPTEGEIDSILVREGDPVVAGDELARISSRNAIELAAQARQAELALAALELDQAQFPATLDLLRRQAEQLAREIEVKQAELDQQLQFGSEILRQRQLAELNKARGDLSESRERRDQSKDLLSRYQQLEGRGISAVEVEDARISYQGALAAYQQADANLRALESRFIAESAAQGTDLANLQVALDDLRIQLGRKRLELEQAPSKLEIDLDNARARAEAARRIRFENTSQGNVLVILSPVSGVVTQVTFSQPGDKVQASTPLVNIAPEGSRKVLKVHIAESDRGFLDEGQVVKMKFAAFPYQRYGFIDGTLEYIAPTTQPLTPGGPMVYEGQVSLEQDYVEDSGERRPLRYGMSAVAEVVVRERRVIDIALDPLRGT